MICVICKEDLSISSFYTRSYDRTKHRTECKKCIGKIRADLNKKRRNQRKLLFIQRFGGKCSKCGYDRNYAALDFHHLGDKEKDIHNILAHHTMEIIENELKKCILICANCHREEHNPHCMINGSETSI